jgi:hypothetical protein
MSFYVTLPSNSSMQYFPNNKCTNYITKLKSSIQLDGPYEVALTEITIPFNWSAVVDGGFVVKNLEKKIDETIKVNWYIDQSANEIVDHFNRLLQKKNLPLTFSYNIQTFLFRVYIPSDYSIQFIGTTGKELGFMFTLAEGSPKKNYFQASNSIPPNANKQSSVYIYSDIIEHQFVGDSFSPLLRTVSVPNNLRYGDTINHNYIQPHYVPVSRNNFDNIEIDIRSDTGDAIHFLTGKVVVKLHFKPKTIF